MSCMKRRSRLRHWRAAVALALAPGLVPAALAAGPDAPLTLEAAAELAVTQQPLLDQIAARARATRASGIAAGELPDPQLTFGVTDVPIDGDDAGSFTADSDTQLAVGLEQEFPRAEKRQLRHELRAREADRLDADHALTERQVRREASLAWLELWRNGQALALADASLRESETQMALAGIALKTGNATQAEYLAARTEVNRLRDEAAGAEQDVEHARSKLSRWIGDAAKRTIADAPASPRPLPTLAELTGHIDDHPEIRDAQAQLAEARTAADLAQAAYRPDWRVRLGYAERPDYPEMVTLEFGIDLPVFTRNRQDQGLAAALAQQDAATAAIEDVRRQWLSEARLNHHDAERITVRLDAYDATLLPQADARVEAAMAGWRSGRSPMRDVLDARRAALEMRLQRLDLQHDFGKHLVQLTYLGAWDLPASGGAPTP